MTQENRTPVHIDITPASRVEAKQGVKITSTNWNPAKGANEARAAAEAAAKAEWEREKALFDADPTQVRLKAIEKQLAALTKKVNALEKNQ